MASALATQPRIQTQIDPLAKQELLRFEHEAARQNSDFATPYKGVSRALPLGAAPVLLTRAQIRPQEGGGITLTLAPEQGGGIDLALNPTLLHSFLALLDQTLLGSDWEQGASVPGGDSLLASTSIN